MRTLLLLNVFAGEEIGARIAKAREEAGFTQEELGDLIDISTRQIQNLEAGVSKPYKHLKTISEVTGKPFDWFLHGDQDEANEEDRLRRIVREELEALRGDLDRIEHLLRSEEQARSQAETPE